MTSDFEHLVRGTLIPELKRNLIDDMVESRRLFHGRGRCFEGLESVCVDWFDPVLVVTLYKELDQQWISYLSENLLSVLGQRCTALVVQKRYLHGGPTHTLFGEMPDQTYAVEASLKYKLRLGRAQNVGFFLDMKEGRNLVKERAPDKRVLNLFSYTCAFSVVALAGGAQQVVNIDVNRGVLASGRENHKLNGLDLRKVSFLNHDVFKSFGKLRKIGPFDLVILDPPTDQGRSFNADTDWPKLISRLPSLVAPGGEVLACLNSPYLTSAFLEEIFRKNFPQAKLANRLGSPPNFPEKHADQGLKILHFTL